MRRYSIELRARKYVRGYRFLSFARKYKKQLLDTGLDAVKSRLSIKQVNLLEIKLRTQ